MSKYLFPALLFVFTFWIGGCAPKALLGSAFIGNTENVKAVIEKGTELDGQNKYGDTALILAANQGHTDIAKLLIEKGAKLDVQNNKGFTALILAADKGDAEIVKLLIEKGAKLDVQSANGVTALIVAAVAGNTELTRLLIENGAKLDVQQQYGESALTFAASKNHTGIAKLLVEKGAKLDLQNKNGDTALTLSVDRGNTEIAKLLIAKGATLDVQNQHGDTALTIAVYKDRSELVKLLIAKGAKLDIQNKTGATALILAVDKDRTEVAKLLIEKGAKLDAQDKNGNTPLILASYKGDIRLVMELLKHGADPLFGFNGKTPRDFAQGAGHAEIVAILEQAIQQAIGPNVNPKKENKPVPPSAPKKPEMRVASTGTGFVVSKVGYVLTNYHVIDDCKEVRAQIPDSKVAVAPVAARDPRNDLALLKLSPSPTMSTATFRGGQIVRQGDSIVAVGFPLHGVLASGVNITTGTVSALAGLGDDTRFLQISAPIQPGNSGGPLLDLSGNVVGVVVSKLDAIRVAKAIGDIPQNVNFAISGAVARGFLDAKGVQYETAHRIKNLKLRMWVSWLRSSLL